MQEYLRETAQVCAASQPPLHAADQPDNSVMSTPSPASIVYLIYGYSLLNRHCVTIICMLLEVERSKQKPYYIVYMYICILAHTCIHVCTYVCLHTRTHTHTHMYAHMHACTHAHTHIHNRILDWLHNDIHCMHMLPVWPLYSDTVPIRSRYP